MTRSADGRTMVLDEVWPYAYALTLGLPRFAVALIVLPMVPSNVFPTMLRIGISISLMLVAFPLLVPATKTLATIDGRWFFLVTKEALIGGSIGYACGLALWAMTTAGEAIDNLCGFNNAEIFNPFLNAAAGPFAQLLTTFGILLFVVAGGLQVFMTLLYESMLLWPPGEVWPTLGPALKDVFIRETNSMLMDAVRMAAPLIGALLLVEFGLGLMNRVAPQFEVGGVSQPIKALTATLVLGLMVMHLVDTLRQRYGDLDRWLSLLRTALPG